MVGVKPAKNFNKRLKESKAPRDIRKTMILIFRKDFIPKIIVMLGKVTSCGGKIQ